MSENLKLWHQVEKTPPEHVKQITGKSYQGTSPKPQYLIMKATETFGPCGIGWGFTVDERIEDGAQIAPGHFERMHIAKVKVWYKWNGELGQVEHIGGTPFSGQRKSGQGYTDEDAPKKSVTDALVKALSMIGFAGDIFMGRYDDSKYVNELKQEEADSKRAAASPKEFVPAVSSAAIALGREINQCKTLLDLNRLKKQPEFIQFWKEAHGEDREHITTVANKRKAELEEPILQAGE